MENGSSWGTWIAYGVISIFLLIVTLLTLRVAVLVLMLVVSPARRLLGELRGRLLSLTRSRPDSDEHPPVEP